MSAPFVLRPLIVSAVTIIAGFVSLYSTCPFNIDNFIVFCIVVPANLTALYLTLRCQISPVVLMAEKLRSVKELSDDDETASGPFLKKWTRFATSEVSDLEESYVEMHASLMEYKAYIPTFVRSPTQRLSPTKEPSNFLMTVERASLEGGGESIRSTSTAQQALATPGGFSQASFAQMADRGSVLSMTPPLDELRTPIMIPLGALDLDGEDVAPSQVRSQVSQSSSDSKASMRQKCTVLYFSCPHLVRLMVDSPQRAADVAQRLVAVLVPLIQRHGGSILHMTASTMTATWNAHVPSSMPEIEGCRAALRLSRTLRRTPDTAWLRWGIAVTCGRVAYGTCGTSEHRAPFVFGECVDVAVPLADLAGIMECGSL